MKIFLDTEFMESGGGRPITLISIGLVDEDGREYYAENTLANLNSANTFVRKNVIPHLTGPKKYPGTMVQDIKLFCGVSPEFWGYYADYDWVIFAQLFGTMVDLPMGYPMYCRDLKQWCDQLGNPSLDHLTAEGNEHHALHDARWNRKAYAFLENVAKQQRSTEHGGAGFERLTTTPH